MGTGRGMHRWGLVLAVMLAVACGDDGGERATSAPPPPEADVTVAGGEMYFDPDTVEVAAGEVTIAFVNVGSTIHDLFAEDLGIHLEALPGETATVTRELTPGEHRFVCTVPGHETAGMVGNFVVD